MVFLPLALLVVAFSVTEGQGAFDANAHVFKTRKLGGPEQQPWRCKPTVTHGGKGTTWKCDYTETTQKVS